MMARDSAELPPEKLSPEAVEGLRAALLLAADDETLSNGGLHDALRRVAAEAHQSGMQAEQLLILFKDLLDSIPVGSSASEKLRRARVRERLVTLCIRAFYARE